LEQAAGLVAERAPAPRVVRAEPAHVLDVGAGDERLLARAGQDDGPRLPIVGELAEPVAQLGQRLDIERVERVLPIDRDDADRAVAPHVDTQAGTAPRRKSTISVVVAPGPNTPATPSLRSSSASSAGIVPPTTTITSSAPFSRSRPRMRGTSV